MYVQNGEKQIVELSFGNRLTGNDFDLTFHRGVYNDGCLGDVGNKLNKLLDIRVFQVHGEVLGHSMRNAQRH